MTNYQDRQPTIRTSPAMSDLNLNGHIFGGWVLSQMDIAGGVEAYRHVDGAVATVAVEGMKFHAPILPGDLLSIYTEVDKIGTTSITIKMEALVSRRNSDKEILVTEGKYIFVALDENHRPKPIEKK